MIALTRFNGDRFILNADKIKYVEETPDTMITLDSGDKLVVREQMADVIRQSIDHARRCRRPLAA
jgi:flagellar protein FlbD